MKKALGRGLESIITGSEQREVRNVPLKSIKTNPFQPRKVFSDEEISELSFSIKENGVLQPIIVRRRGEFFEIIAGERRFRACTKLGMKDIPAIVKDISDEKMLEYAIIENVQRMDLNPVDEAGGYKELVEKFHLTHEELSNRVGKSRSHITNILRILDLETHIRTLMSENKISFGHAKVLLSIKDKNKRIMFADKAAKEHLSVRDLEFLVLPAGSVSLKKEKKAKQKSSHIKRIEEKLSEMLSRKAEVFYRKGKGRVSLEFYNDDDFKLLLEKLGLKNFD